MAPHAPDENVTCPACGGAGGGPFGRAGTGWDIETYECPRCEGAGVVLVRDEEARAAAALATPKPGVAKTQPGRVTPQAPTKRASSGES